MYVWKKDNTKKLQKKPPKNKQTNKKKWKKRKTKNLGKHFTLFSFGIHKIVSNSNGSANVHV